MRVSKVKELLAGVREHLWESSLARRQASQAIQSEKRSAIASGDQDLAKECWCLETALYIQKEFIGAFRELKQGAFYDAWCTLEKVEIAACSLSEHCCDGDDSYLTEFIGSQVSKFQSLFPYRMFLSPSLVIRKCRCSICGQEMSIRNPCGHRRGEIYDGELCARIVEDADLLEVSFVPNPVQKYSVVFPKDSDGASSDPYDYRLVEYVTRGLRAPFDAWDVEWTKIRHPHELYSHYARGDQCPCGSGKTYESCCLQESGVLRPHARVLFSVPPPEDLPAIAYPVAEFPDAETSRPGELQGKLG